MKHLKMNNGDTYALKIIFENKNYDGKYLIINKIDEKKVENGDYHDVVRIKIANFLPEQINEETINALEYVKPFFFWYEEWSSFISPEKVKELEKYMNKFKMIFIYTIELVELSPRKTKDFCEELIYLGNFDLIPPENEFIPENYLNILRGFLSKERFINSMITSYEAFNLKKSPAFDYEFSAKQNFIHRNARLMTEEYLASIQKNPVKKSDTKRHRDTLTYVGDE
ncbi:MAG: hypothetical protein ACI4XM_06930 [Candidatus Coprovivens sp.]